MRESVFESVVIREHDDLFGAAKSKHLGDRRSPYIASGCVRRKTYDEHMAVENTPLALQGHDLLSKDRTGVFQLIV
jgi:hypothetical protein